jgi:GDP-L-fucose synthase
VKADKESLARITTSRLDGQTIYIAGHTGLVGSALYRYLSKNSNASLLTISRSDLELTQYDAVERFLKEQKPDWVVIAAGRVGGIGANAAYPAEFIYQNLMIEANLIHASWRLGIRQLINFGSACVYPKDCPQPMKVEALWTGKLEPTSQPYAVAKLAGMEMCEAYNRQYRTRYINAIPANLYGPGDHFDLDRAHVIAALLRRFHDATKQGLEEVKLWGTGKARREFLFVNDLAEACQFLLTNYEGTGPVNIGSGETCSIQELAQTLVEVTGYQGKIVWDSSKPDGAEEKSLDSKPLFDLGWKPKTSLKDGLKRTYAWFLEKNQE